MIRKADIELTNKNVNTKHLAKLLDSFGDRYVDNNGNLKKSNLVHDVQDDNLALFKVLVHDPLVMQAYAKDVDGVQVFDKDRFITTVNDAKLWHHNYTKFRNHIGLTVDDKYINDSSDVVLDFPHKDCVLQGGMTKEENDTNVHENFYNDTISSLQVTNMFAPKILCHAKRYDKEHIKGVPTDHFDSKHDSLMIKANNLIALHSLLPVYRGKIKLIYIDPPYNTGSDSFKYNDNFNHSTWLVFMKNRLDIAKKLLASNGLIFVQISDVEQAYLKVLMDEVFGRHNYVNIITVKTKISGVSGSSRGKSLRHATEFIHIFAKNEKNVKLNPVYHLVPVSQYVKHYKAIGKSWKYTRVLVSLGSAKELTEDKIGTYYYYPKAKMMNLKMYASQNHIKEAEVYEKIPERIFETTNAQSSIRKRVMKQTKDYKGLVGFRYRPIKGKNAHKLITILYNGPKKRMLMWLSDRLVNHNGELMYGSKLSTLWDSIQYNNLIHEGGIKFPNGKKPEKLLQYIIALATNPGDLVLDFFMGSATTQSVAMKMHRRFIGIEQMNYFDTISVPRLQNVIKGDQNGISKDVNWKGGGSFVYATFLNHNQAYIEAIQNADGFPSLDKVCAEISSDADIRLDVDFQELKDNLHKLSLAEAKQSLLDSLDKNQLYYNEADINDVNVRHLPGLSSTDRQFNQSFYGRDDK